MEKSFAKSIALIGGGPAALFMLKRILENPGLCNSVFIFEKYDQLGVGMPYGNHGACYEHITNISDRELPELETSIKDWIAVAPHEMLQQFGIDQDSFNEDKVVPRLLFGKYLEEQFDILRKKARQQHLPVEVLFNTEVTDMADLPETGKVLITDHNNSTYEFDSAVVCIGHRWPKTYEDKIPGWYDSPYPPSKLKKVTDFPVAVRGASLTAVDVVKTLSRENGVFSQRADGMLTYKVHPGSSNFKIVLHALGGLLPAVRFHLSQSALSTELALPEEEIRVCKEANNGFVDLDYIYQQHFLVPLKKSKPELYETVKNLSLEGFVEHMMAVRRKVEPFKLLKAEYTEAKKSIERHESVVWKELLASLSYTINYAAKHFCAEDMLRMRKVLMPLVSIIIASLPQSSCREFLAMHDAGVLEMVAVGPDSECIPNEKGGAIYQYRDENDMEQTTYYELFIDAIGQAPMPFQQFPFEGLKEQGAISAAHVLFKDDKIGEKAFRAGDPAVRENGHGKYYLQVSGISINDSLQILDRYGAINDRIYILAVPYIGGLNPDYSGLDFCEAGSLRIIEALRLLQH